MKRIVFVLLLPLLFSSACSVSENSDNENIDSKNSSHEAEDQKRTAFYAGEISEMEAEKEILVSGRSQHGDVNDEKFIFRLQGDTTILTPDGKERSVDDLDSGQKIKVWLKRKEGLAEIDDSKPRQADAENILITNK